MYVYMYLCWTYATCVCVHIHRGLKGAGVSGLCGPLNLHSRFWTLFLLIKLSHLFRTSDKYFITSLLYLFCSCIDLLLSLWLCSWIWGHILWCLQLCSFCLGLLYLLAGFHNSTLTLGYFLILWWGLHWACRPLLII